MDVLFLDIQMPGLTGFDLLARLDRQPAVIFTTAYDQYALKAFEVNSIDYLLKPVDPKQLDRALTKLEQLRGAGVPDAGRARAARTACRLAPQGRARIPRQDRLADRRARMLRRTCGASRTSTPRTS